MTVTASITDVQCAVVSPSVGCAALGADVFGFTMLRLPIRRTDHWSGPGPATPPPCGVGGGGPPCTTATVVDHTFDFPIPCGAAGDPGTPPGSTCTISTSFDAAFPGYVTEFQRSSFRTTDEVVVFDPGPDGSVVPTVCMPSCGTGDELPFLAEGWFAP